MPEIAAAHRAAQRAGGAPSRRVAPMFAGGVALVSIVGLLAYPYASADETRRATRKDDRAAARTAFAVVVPTLTTVRESVVTSPPLAETLPGRETQRNIPPKAAAPAARVADAGQPSASRPAPALAVATPYAVPARDADVTGDEHGADPAPPTTAPPAPIDPMNVLGDALGACARSSGVWERATCEQRARLAHCDGYWGNVALCPAGRTDFGQ